MLFRSPAERLAVVERLERGENVDVHLHEVGEFCEKARTLDAARVETPGGVEGVVGGLDGGIDVLGGTLGDAGGDLAVRRVDDAERERSVNLLFLSPSTS